MFTCISCRVAFEDAAEQRTHFSTDWHRYNMKRRVASLPPVAATAFNEKVVERREQNAVRTDPRDLACEACRKTFSSENAYRSHVQSRKHRDRELAYAKNPSHFVDEGKTDHAEGDVDMVQSANTSEHDQSSRQPIPQPSVQDMGDESSDNATDDEDEDEGDIEAKLAASRRRRHLPSDCLFCTQRLPTIEACLQHMSTLHSFFIPDQDYLSDLSGLLAYLAEKVIVGNICLYCPGGSREFGSVEAVRRHMIDKSHCKMAFETDDDRIEMSDFYTYEGEGGVGDEWEDVDDAGGTDGGLETSQSHMPTLADDGLSLTLPSGRVLGHRALRVYYSQRLRPSPQFASSDDMALSKVALVKQRLADPSLALIPVAGGMGGYGRGLEMMKARNAGEAKWARAQARSFKDQNAKRQHMTKIAFKHNSQKHFRDPLLQ